MDSSRSALRQQLRGPVPTVLLILLAAGACLRIGAMLAESRGFLGYTDTASFINMAQGQLFADSWRPSGYPVFLRIAHVLAPSLSFVIVVQHLLGLGTAVLLFFTVRRVAPAAWGLLPAAIILLSGPQLLLEHAALAEALFTFLIALVGYFAVRALEAGPVPWAYLAGLSAGVAACVRVIGLLLPVLVGIALVAALPRRRLHAAAAVALATLLVVGIYVGAMRHQTHYTGFGLTRAGSWAVYTRVAPFADCNRFTPPAGTRRLCESKPPAKRPDPTYYSLTAASPAVRMFGNPFAPLPRGNRQLSAFTRAAILHQPFDYVGTVTTDLTRYWSSDRHYDTYAGQSYEALARSLVGRNQFLPTVFQQGWYDTTVTYSRKGLTDALRSYERHTRLEGPLLVLLALLTIAGIPLARGRRLAAGLLMVGFALITLLAPVMTAFWDARYAVAGYGSLAVAAAIGGASLLQRVAWQEGRLQLRAPTPAAAAVSAPVASSPPRAPTKPPPRAKAGGRRRH